jgi:hypothetical protein
LKMSYDIFDPQNFDIKYNVISVLWDDYSVDF